MKVVTILMVLFLATFLYAINENPPAPDNAKFHQLSAAPDVDGVKDAVYDANIDYHIAMLDTTCADTDRWARIPGDELDGYVTGGWIGDSIYFFFDVSDDTLNTVPANPWDNDSVELYFDGDNSKGTTYDTVDDVQLRVEYTDPNGNSAGVDGGGAILADAIAAMNYAAVANAAEDGYKIEVAILIDVLQLPAVGTSFGWECQINENDGSGRTALLRWHDQANEGWHDVSVLGNATRQPANAIDNFNTAGIVKDFSLDQNYPNPFNPTTTITYRLNKAAKVKLTVYNILGKEVATLVNKVQTPNSYDITFDASKLSSGVYFYKLQVGANVETKKMILMK
jgi:hypothetical protein